MSIAKLSMRSDRPATLPRGFSIVELLVVLFIIGLVMSILVPAVSGVRQTARKAATSSTMKDLSTASNSFMNDRKGIVPGYFPNSAMGAAANADRGMSSMQNILLDLSGGIVTIDAIANGNNNGCDELAGPSVVEVGPTTTTVAKLNLQLFGSPTKNLANGVEVRAYFNPDKSSFARQCTDAQRPASVVGHKAMPEVVDAWGNPILAWSRDERATEGNPFAAIDSSAGPASFYWTSNAGILSATGLGRTGRNHLTGSSSSTAYSMIGAGVASGATAQLVGSPTTPSIMEALLGNPAFPMPLATGGTPKPARARGSLIFQAAGIDGWFMGSEDRGGKMAGAASGIGTNPFGYTPNIDSIQNFDDIVMSAIN